VVALSRQTDAAKLLDCAAEQLRETPTASCADFLRLVIRGSQARDLGPRMHEIIQTLTALIYSKDVADRKSAVFCIAEMRTVLGKRLDVEISKLLPVARKLVQFYAGRTESEFR
jgi:hypothetical protein